MSAVFRSMPPGATASGSGARQWRQADCPTRMAQAPRTNASAFSHNRGHFHRGGFGKGRGAGGFAGGGVSGAEFGAGLGDGPSIIPAFYLTHRPPGSASSFRKVMIT